MTSDQILQLAREEAEEAIRERADDPGLWRALDVDENEDHADDLADLQQALLDLADEMARGSSS